MIFRFQIPALLQLNFIGHISLFSFSDG